MVLEAAHRVSPDFVITNSGPAVSPRAQEAYSTANRLRALDWPDEKVRGGESVFAELLELLGSGVPFDAACAWLRRAPLAAELIAAGAFAPDSEPLWKFAAALINYDPRPALERLDVPLLALLGERDTVVPVEQSVAVFRAAVSRDLLELRIIDGGDHRLQSGDEFAPGYLDTLTTFVTRQCA